MRRRIKKIDPVDGGAEVKPVRKVVGLEAKRWCPSFDHRGPWTATGGLIAPDVVSAVGLEVITALAPRERCEWCGEERELTGIELRRRLRTADFTAAREARRVEEITTRRPSLFARGRPRKTFLLEISNLRTRHLVGRHKTFCGSPVKDVAWDNWSGVSGQGLSPNRCPVCHKEALRLTDDQFDVAFAYMLAIARLFNRRHPQDPTRKFDLETGRCLLEEEWTGCDACDCRGTIRPDETAFNWLKCEDCSGRGWSPA